MRYAPSERKQKLASILIASAPGLEQRLPTCVANAASSRLSFATMRELRIGDASTTDHHFRQAGPVPLLKN